MNYFDSVEQPARRRPKIGYGGYYDQEPTLDQQPMTEEEREGLLSQIGEITGQATSILGDWLDKPGQGVRYLLTGGEATDAGEMLDHFGIRPDKDMAYGWARPVADFAAGLLTDPLTYVGTGTLNSAGKAAKAAGLLDDAARAASTIAARNGDVAGRHAQNALGFYRQLGRGAGELDILDDISPFEMASRPLIGSRQAKRNMTLRQLVDEQADPAAAMSRLANQFKPGTSLDGMLDRRLTSDIGFGMPLSDYTPIGINIPGGENIARGLDLIGQQARWSAPGRLAHKLFNRNVANTYDAVDQHFNDASNRWLQHREVETRGRLHDQTQHLAEALSDPENSRAVRNVIELGGTAEERALVAANPHLQEFVDNAPGWLRAERERRMDWGVMTPELIDETGTKHFPRYTSDFSFQELIDQNARNKGAGLLSSIGSESIKRADHLKVPGGTKVLNELSQDPDLVRQLGQTAEEMMPRRERARIIRERLNREFSNPDTFPGGMTQEGSHRPKQVWDPTTNAPVEGFDANQANSIANLLENMDPRASATGMPLFGRNVLDDYIDYMVGSDKAVSANQFLQDMMARSTTVSRYADDAGRDVYQAASELPGRRASVPEALQEMTQRSSLDPNTPLALDPEMTPGAINPLTGLAYDPRHDFATTGAKDRVLNLLRERFPNQIEEIDHLNRATLTRDTLTRLANIGRLESSPEAKSAWVRMWDDVTRVWKSTLLSWPAKFTRDWYGGKFINLVMTGGAHLLDGEKATKALIQGDLPALDKHLAQIRKYADLGSPEARLQAFRRDMFSNKGLEVTRNMDLQSLSDRIQTAGKTVDAMLPGNTQNTTVGYQAWDAMTGKGTMPLSTMAENELLTGANWSVGNPRNFSVRDPVNFITGRDAAPFAQLGLLDQRNIQNPILRWGAAIGDTTEKMNRMSGTFALMMQGWDPGEAIRAMKNAHTDPSSLTKIEREWIRRAFPFWSFTSRIGKFVAEQVIERPGGRYTQLGLRLPSELLSPEDEDYIPESIKANYGFKSNLESNSLAARIRAGIPFGNPKQGVTPWVTDIDLPGIDTINLVRPSYESDGSLSIAGTAFKTAEDFVGRNAAPGVKGLLELTTGIDSYTKRPLKESESAPQQLLEKITGIRPESTAGQFVGTLKPAIDTVPFAPRFFQTTNRLFDSERVESLADRAFQMGINATTGVKIQNIDDQIKRIDARKKIADLLQDDPMVKSFSQVYIPEELKPYVDPVTARMMALDRQLGREVKREKALRRGEPINAKRRTPDPVSYFD